MGSATQYWTFLRPGSNDYRAINHNYHTIEQFDLKDFLKQRFAAESSTNLPSTDLLNIDLPDTDLQKCLFALTKDATADPKTKILAEQCLRCRISHRIINTCEALVGKYGKYYGFSLIDLLDLVCWYDDLKPFKPKLKEDEYQPLAQQILETYKPEEGSLDAWVTCKVRDHPKITRFLLQRGLCRKSDWGILNDTSISRLERILTQDGLSTKVVEPACSLLSSYKKIYQSSGRRGERCEAPDKQKLQAMAAILGERLDGEEAIRTFQQRLEKLAQRLREDYIEARGGKIREEGFNTLEELERAMDNAAIQHSQEEDHEIEESTQDLYQSIITTHQESLLRVLDQVVAQVIENRYQRLAHSTRKGQLEEANNYWRGLKLFFVENQSFEKIALLIYERKDQPAVTRLLELGKMLQDVRRLTLHGMLIEIRQMLKTFSLQTREDLEAAIAQIDDWMAKLTSDCSNPNNIPLEDSEIAKPIDELLEEEKKRRMTRPDRKQPNRFTEAVCRYLKTRVR